MKSSSFISSSTQSPENITWNWALQIWQKTIYTFLGLFYSRIVSSWISLFLNINLCISCGHIKITSSMFQTIVSKSISLFKLDYEVKILLGQSYLYSYMHCVLKVLIGCNSADIPNNILYLAFLKKYFKNWQSKSMWILWVSIPIKFTEGEDSCVVQFYPHKYSTTQF